MCACMQAGLVGGEGFAIDASVIEADASRNHRIEGKLTAAPADAAATRPVREYLEALDKSAAAETAKRADDGDDARRGNKPAEPKYTSLTDPAAAWTNKGQMKALFAYGTNYLIDTKAAIIVDVEATPARWSAEVAATKTMLTRTQESFGLTPETLAADAAYGSGLMLGWLMRRGIDPHIPILDREHQTKGYFTRADFTFDATANVFTCPAGKKLLNGLVRDDGTMPYRASTRDCRDCALKARCTKAASRIVTRNLYEAERAHVRGLRETPDTSAHRVCERRSRCVCASQAQPQLRRLRLRGLSGAKDEFLLAAAAQTCASSSVSSAKARRQDNCVPCKRNERGRMPPGPTLGGKIGDRPRDRHRADHPSRRKITPAESFSTASLIFAHTIRGRASANCRRRRSLMLSCPSAIPTASVPATEAGSRLL